MLCGLQLREGEHAHVCVHALECQIMDKFQNPSNPEFIAVFARAHHWSPILSQMNPFHIPTSYFSKIIIIL
jgi:hypothetical protein